MSLSGKTALVTGASSGIGMAMARIIGARGGDLIITARRAAELEKLAAEIRAASSVKVTVIALDLSQRDAAAELYRQTEGAGQPVDLLINNAGFGIHQYFLDIPWEQTAQQIQLNMTSLTELCHSFGRAMVGRRRGYIMNVASVGAYTPCPGYATYAAGKSYVRNFSEALAAELAPHGVRVCCLCPGATETEFSQVAGQSVAAWQRLAFMSAERCARIGLDSLLGGRRNVVSGWLNKAGMFLTRFLPRRTMVWMGGVTVGRPSHSPSPAPALPPAT